MRNTGKFRVVRVTDGLVFELYFKGKKRLVILHVFGKNGEMDQAHASVANKKLRKAFDAAYKAKVK